MDARLVQEGGKMGDYQALAQTNIIDPYDDESDDVYDEDALVEKFEEEEEMTMLIHGLHRRAGLQGGENQANKHSCPQEEAQGLGVSVKRKRRRRLGPDPYANVPFVVWEIMYDKKSLEPFFFLLRW